MAGKTRHLVNRSGRYHARLVVPKDLREAVGKTELRRPLGGDKTQALRLLPGAVAELQHEIARAERKVMQSQPRPRPARYPLTPSQIATSYYTARMVTDDYLRNDPRYALQSIDDGLVQRLREAVAGRADDKELVRLVGRQLSYFYSAGNFEAERGNEHWRMVARALCSAELEALARVAERDEGDFTGAPTDPLIVEAEPTELPQTPVKLTGLWADYVASRRKAGFMRDKARRQTPAIESLRAFLGHDNARRITKKDMLAWREHLMETRSAKTVSDVYLSTIRSLLSWAVDNDRLEENVAQNVRQPKPRKVHTRERGYTDAEADKLLKASRAYEPTPDEFGNVRESAKMMAVKRWVPMLCAFTGARVTEITQLRKEDIRDVDGMWVARITPDAGTVKAGGYRDVPLHRQLVDEGFIEFLKEAQAGPLFHNAIEPERYHRAAEIESRRVCRRPIDLSYAAISDLSRAACLGLC